MTLDLGPDLAPVSESERAAFLRAAGILDRADAPPGFEGYAAIWARDRDLLVGQGVLVELTDDARRPGFLPAHLPADTRVLLIDMLAVRAEYRETGLEERISRALIRPLRREWPRPDEAVIYMGEMCAPVLLSTLRGLGERSIGSQLARPDAP